MKITCLGAVGEVTGSCHLLEVNGHRILLDCGLFQGSYQDEARNAEPFPFKPEEIDAVVLSHAHIDHSGRIPLLIRQGYTGPVYTQEATRDLCRILLKDSAMLAERDAHSTNRKRARKGLPLVEPLYTAEVAKAAMRHFKVSPYDQEREILPGVRIAFRDAGHIVGSAIVELWLKEGPTKRKVVFSGDLGHDGGPFLRSPTVIQDADLVLMESTYGDRLHRSWEETYEEMKVIFQEATHSGGNILIPAFAVGRAQGLLYVFRKFFRDWGLEHWRIFLDSPMAIEATEVYASHTELYDNEGRAFWKRHKDRQLVPNLYFCRTVAQSMNLNRIQKGAIIVAGSGMCTGGRIRHHLKNHVWRRDCHVIIVGYQARGTTGRALVDGAKYIGLWGEAVRVEAKVHTVGGLSHHADQEGLLRWYGHFRGHPALVLVHGEPRAQEALAKRIHSTYHKDVAIAGPGFTLDL
jgi:metallo-beta-lactamase family protein